MINLIKNYTHKLEKGIIDEFGNFKSGLTVTYEIRKSSDNSLIASGTATDISGIYSFTHTFTETGEYRMKFMTPSGYEDGYDTIFVEEEYAKEETLDSHRSETEDRIKRILGMTQENFIIKDQTYNSNGSLETATVRIFNNALDCNSDINPLAEYSIIVEYDLEGKIKKYKVTRS